MGGGVYYNLVRPIMENITNYGNIAQYGPDIASYPVKIVQKGTQNNKIYLDNVPAGLEYQDTLEFDLVDYDGQVMNLQSSTSVKILILDSYLSIRGTNMGRVINGQAQIENIIFVGQIGKTNARYSLTSSAIDSKIINEILDNSNQDYDNYIDVSFRY